MSLDGRSGLEGVNLELTREKALVMAFTVLLSAMAVLGGAADPPVVPIPLLVHLDPGSKVRTEGMAVDLRQRDDGTRTLILLDGQTGSTAKVFISREADGQRGERPRIGDVVSVRGELSVTGSSVAMFAESSDVRVVQPAELVMSVTLLTANWRFFENDRFAISGILDLDPVSGVARLFDSSMTNSIELRSATALSRFAGETVAADVVLLLDADEMSFYLAVESITDQK